eukprot:5337741-Pleurochrysis_carterae.AAC.3
MRGPCPPARDALCRRAAGMKAGSGGVFPPQPRGRRHRGGRQRTGCPIRRRNPGRRRWPDRRKHRRARRARVPQWRRSAQGGESRRRPAGWSGAAPCGAWRRRWRRRGRQGRSGGEGARERRRGRWCLP